MSDREPLADEPARPMLRIVRGGPTAEQLAALMAVVSARAAAADTAAGPPRSSWNDPARLVREPVSPRAGGWVAAGRPR